MFRKILVPVDSRPVTQSAIGQAIEIAQLHRADILFLGVLPQPGYTAVDMLPMPDSASEEFHAKAAEEASRALLAASALAERQGVHSHRATTIAADPAHAVAEAALKRHCDVIVVGTEEHNAVVRLINGSIVPGLISKASVPVLVCREKQVRHPRGAAFARAPAVRHVVREVGTRDDEEPND